MDWGWNLNLKTILWEKWVRKTEQRWRKGREREVGLCSLALKTQRVLHICKQTRQQSHSTVGSSGARQLCLTSDQRFQGINTEEGGVLLEMPLLKCSPLILTVLSVVHHLNVTRNHYVNELQEVRELKEKSWFRLFGGDHYSNHPDVSWSLSLMSIACLSWPLLRLSVRRAGQGGQGRLSGSAVGSTVVWRKQPRHRILGGNQRRRTIRQLDGCQRKTRVWHALQGKWGSSPVSQPHIHKATFHTQQQAGPLWTLLLLSPLRPQSLNNASKWSQLVNISCVPLWRPGVRPSGRSHLPSPCAGCQRGRSGLSVAAHRASHGSDPPRSDISPDFNKVSLSPGFGWIEIYHIISAVHTYTVGFFPHSKVFMFKVFPRKQRTKERTIFRRLVVMTKELWTFHLFRHQKHRDWSGRWRFHISGLWCGHGRGGRVHLEEKLHRAHWFQQGSGRDQSRWVRSFITYMYLNIYTCFSM